jgi:hypothetical protein
MVILAYCCAAYEKAKMIAKIRQVADGHIITKPYHNKCKVRRAAIPDQDSSWRQPWIYSKWIKHLMTCLTEGRIRCIAEPVSYGRVCMITQGKNLNRLMELLEDIQM